MGLLVLFLCIPNAASHALLNNGANAEDLLGHFRSYPTATVPDYTTTGLISPIGFNNLGDVALDTVNHRLFVAERDNNRIMVFALNSDNSIGSKEPTHVLGQPDFYTNTAANTQSGLNQPWGVAYDSSNDRLFVSEVGGNRVKVFNLSGGITNGMNAANVLGQTTWTGASAGDSQSQLRNLRSIAYDGTNQRLFVSEWQGANRVKVFDVASISNGENAVNILGQTTWTGTSAANTQSGLNEPRDVEYDSANQRLFIAEQGGNRVKVFDLSGGITNGMNATNILGQTTWTGASAANSQSRLNDTCALAYDSANQRLFVAEDAGNRIKIF